MSRFLMACLGPSLINFISDFCRLGEYNFILVALGIAIADSEISQEIDV